jgi:hypothetical protein
MSKLIQGCITTLRYEWLSNDAHFYAIQVKKGLCTILPVSSSAVLTHVLCSNLEIENINSYMFLLLLVYNTNLIRSTESSFCEGCPTNSSIINIIQLLLPSLMHLYSGFSWNIDSFANLVLIFSLSFIAQADNLEILMKNSRNWCKTPTKKIFQLYCGIFIATISCIYTFLIPFTESMKKFMTNEEENELLLVSFLFFSAGLLVVLLSFHLKNKRKRSGDLRVGKVHDEMILILALFSMILMAFALSPTLELRFLFSTTVLSLFFFVGRKMVSSEYADNITVQM